VSDPRPRSSTARIVSSRSHRAAELERALSALGAAEIVIRGSAGLKERRGRSRRSRRLPGAGLRRPALGCLRLRSAGRGGGRPRHRRHGRLTRLPRRELSNDSGMLASNGLLHDAVLERVSRLHAEP
jgi:hypothetical protein